MQRIKFKEHVILSDVLKTFVVHEDTYELDSCFDEFVTVFKSTRGIIQFGYTGLIQDWIILDLIELY